MTKKTVENQNVVGGTFDPKSAACREFDVQELHNIIARSGISRAGSWGFESGTTITKNKVYRFSVNGIHHKGYVYITLGWSDTFDIFYTDKKDVIKKTREMVYIMELIETLDADIERIPEYIR